MPELAELSPLHLTSLWLVNDYLMLSKDNDRYICRALGQSAARASTVGCNVSEVLKSWAFAATLPESAWRRVFGLAQRIDSAVLSVHDNWVFDGLGDPPFKAITLRRSFKETCIRAAKGCILGVVQAEELQLAALWGQVNCF